VRRTIIACVIVALVAGATSATAAKLITGKDIKNGSVTGGDIKKGSISNEDIENGTVYKKKLSKAVRDQLNATGASGGTPPLPGPPGPKGDKGDKGDTGPTASAGDWGIQNRNTVGSPDIGLRAGPNLGRAGAAGAQRPPNGTGSLNFSVADGSERAAFGNEVTFTGSSFDTIGALGFWVYTVGENIPPASNLPNISFEVDPNMSSAPGDNFATLSFAPPAQAPGWGPFVDATATGLWSGTGEAFDGGPCDPDGSLCTWTVLKGLLDDGGNAATILSVGVTKGSDLAWHGAIDALRVNATIYDFEEHGVVQRAA
jgi:hypothetical protein